MDEFAAVAREVCKQMGFDFSPNSVTWARYSPIRGDTPAVLPPDHCVVLRDRLVLPESMKGILTPEEWKPLIGSSLIHYYSKARRRADKIQTARLLVFCLAIVAFFAVGFFLYGPTANIPPTSPYVLAIPVLFPAIIALILYVDLSFRKTIWLMSDELACQKLGDRREMLNVLNKIAGLGLEDIDMVEKSRTPVARYGRPKLSERITSLSQTSLQ